MLNFTKINIFIIYFIFLFTAFFATLNFQNIEDPVIDKKVNLGLDLQGGSYILLEIDSRPLVNQKLQSRVIPIKKLLNENKIIFQNFLISKDNISFLVNKAQHQKLENLFF